MAENNRYALFKSLHRLAAHVELLTTYGRDYWLQRQQWIKLSSKERALCEEFYNITEADLIG